MSVVHQGTTERQRDRGGPMPSLRLTGSQACVKQIGLCKGVQTSLKEPRGKARKTAFGSKRVLIA